jgi:hypothetical protein
VIITHTLEDTTIENALKTFEDLYLKKDYPNAILTLEKNQHEINAGLWHYNMGIALGQMNNWPMARFHFILAEASGVHSQELFQNLKLVEDKLDTVRLEQPLSTSDYIIKTGIIASDGPLLSLGFLFLVVGLWFLKKKPSLKSALLFVLAVASPLMLDLWIDSWTRKIVITTTQIYEGPSALFGVKGELPQGLMVMTNTKGEWENIIFPSRFSGWIKSDGLKRLELK